jgi:hypothetical protein
MRNDSITRFVSLFVMTMMFASAAYSQNKEAKSCRTVGGTVLSNLGVIDQNTTLGIATGDLKGAVAAAILSITQNPDGTVSFSVNHHWVTESGDSIFVDPPTAVTRPLSATLFAIVSYPIHITGGTGKFAKATGDLNSIGEVDLAAGTTGFRYTGKICNVN